MPSAAEVFYGKVGAWICAYGVWEGLRMKLALVETLFALRELAESQMTDAQSLVQAFRSGKSVSLYHGTTRLFRKFSLSYSRDDLVDKFYGRGIFLTPDRHAAERYAHANRNMGFPASIVTDLRRKNKAAGDLLAFQMKFGFEGGWDKWMEANKVHTAEEIDAKFGDLDANLIDDIAPYVLGSKVKPVDAGGPTFIFSKASGLPDYIYDTLDELGLSSKTYRPKVYTVRVKSSNPLVTSSQAQARKAQGKGFDAVIYTGPDIVGDMPEVAVYDPSNVRITKISVVN